MEQLNQHTILSRVDDLAELFVSEHRNPVNRALHFWIGMPLAGIGLALMVFLKWQGILVLLLGYGAMFIGHYMFEKNPPTIVKTPLGPFSAIAFVIRHFFIRPFRRRTAAR